MPEINFYEVHLFKTAKQFAYILMLATSESDAEEKARKIFGEHLKIVVRQKTDRDWVQIGGNLIAITEQGTAPADRET